MKDFSKLILGIIVVLLGIFTLFLWSQNQKLKQQTDVYMAEKASINIEYDELQREFDELTNEMQSLTQVKNEEISQQKEELEEKKIKISRLLRKERLTVTELEQARGMIDELRVEKNQLLAKIKELNHENLHLNQQNKNLTLKLTKVGARNEQLNSENQSLQTENTTLQTNQKLLKEQKIKVEQQRNDLAKEKMDNISKVLYAELLKINNLQVYGFKHKKNGLKRVTTNHRKVDQLGISFHTEKNPVATNGTKKFYVRIINPDGTVMYDKQKGSGEFTNHNEEGMKYTTKTAINYQAEAKDISLFWQQNLPYQKGDYIIEVYQSGYKVANGQFEL